MSYRFVLPQRIKRLFNGIGDFDLKRQMGSGALSTVHEAVHKQTGKQFAIKKIDLDTIGNMDQENVEKEIEAHKIMDHKNIVKLFDFFMEGRIVYLVMEYCRRGNLFRYLNRHVCLPEDEIKKMFRQTCEGIAYMHSLRYINRDLKPENLLLDDENNIKICDLGWACHLNEIDYRKLKAGTYAYMSPESLTGTFQDEATDVWALGILLFELIFNKEPYSGISCNDQLKRIKQAKPDFSKRNISEEAKRLILQILQIEKQNRPSINTVLSSEFLRAVGKSAPELYNPRLFTKLENVKMEAPILTEIQNNVNRTFKPPQVTNLQNFYQKKENLTQPSIPTIYGGFKSHNVSRESSLTKKIIMSTSRPISIDKNRISSTEHITTNLYSTINNNHYTSTKFITTPRSIRYNASSQSFHDHSFQEPQMTRTTNIYGSISNNGPIMTSQRHNTIIHDQLNQTTHTTFVTQERNDSLRNNGLYSTSNIGSTYTSGRLFQTYLARRG